MKGGHVEVGGTFPVIGLNHLKCFAVRDKEANLVYKAPAVVQAHGELDHQLAADSHVHNRPVPGGSGVLVHDVHMFVSIEVGDIQGRGAILRENGGQGLAADRGGGLGGGEDVKFHVRSLFLGANVRKKK